MIFFDVKNFFNGSLSAPQDCWSKVVDMKREKTKVDKSLENLVMALEQIMSATTNKRLHEIEKQQAELMVNLLVR